MARGNQKQKSGLAKTSLADDNVSMENKTPNEIMATALVIATKAHEGQFRNDQKTPYIDHPKRVADGVEGWKAKTVAYLHDALEDNPEYTEKAIKDANLPPDVVDAIRAMTKPKPEPKLDDKQPYDKAKTAEAQMTYLDYIRKQIAPNKLARQVKIADIKANLADNPKDYQRARYIKALAILENI